MYITWVKDWSWCILDWIGERRKDEGQEAGEASAEKPLSRQLTDQIADVRYFTDVRLC